MGENMSQMPPGEFVTFDTGRLGGWHCLTLAAASTETPPPLPYGKYRQPHSKSIRGSVSILELYHCTVS